MNKIGIFYGSEEGTTRAIAEAMYRFLGDDIADAPIDVGEARPEELLRYDAIIAGTPSYGVAELPGRTAGSQGSSWEEFLYRLDDRDLSGKRVALFGLGNQAKYFDRFAGALIHLHRFFRGCGAKMIGQWSTQGYAFTHSPAVVDDRFVGLVIDHHTQPTLTKDRLVDWLEEIRPQLLESPRQEAPAR